MKGMCHLIIFVGILLVVSSAWGDYYQYKDPDGVVRFTDDPTVIPAEQRDDVKVHESIISLPPESEPISDSEENSVSPVMKNEEQSPPGKVDSVEPEEQSPPGNEGRAQSEELNIQREELLKIYREIEAEKKALGGPPPKNAKSGVKADYEIMSQALNKKIEEYNKQSMAFEEKVKAFNSQVGKK